MRYLNKQRCHISSFKVLALLLLLIITAHSNSAFADTAANQQKLIKLQEKIDSIQKDLEKDNKQ
jgi:hypothetical protein